MPCGLGRPIDAHGRVDSNALRVRSGHVCLRRRANRRLPCADRSSIRRGVARTGIRQRRAGAGSNRNEPPAVAAPAPTVTDIVLGITASEDLQRATLARLEQAGQWRELADRVAALEAKFDALPASPAATGELIDAVTRARQLRGLHGEVSTVVDELELVARQLEHDRRMLDSRRSEMARAYYAVARKLGSRADPRACGERWRRSSKPRTLAFATIRMPCWSRLTAPLRCGRAWMTPAPLSRLRRRAFVRKGCNWSNPRCGRSARHPLRFDVVAAEVAAAWRSLGTYFTRDGTFLTALFVGVLALTGWLFTRGPAGRGRSARRAEGGRLPHRCSLP